MARPRSSPQPEVPGLAARRIAADILDGVLRRRIALDEQLSGKGAHPGLAALADRDRALMRRLAATALRRLGTLRHLLGGFLERASRPTRRAAETILLIGAVQILWLEVPDHAAVDLSVRLAQADRRAARYAGLVNAVLRRVAQNRDGLAVDDTTRDTPDWLLARWTQGLRRRDRARDRRRQRPRAGARSHRQGGCRRLGRASARARAADRQRAHAGARRDRAAARLYRRRLVGAGRRRLAAGAAVRRRARACASPICARRPAARPRNWRMPARASPRSTARRRGLPASPRISRGLRSRPRRSPPTCWNGRRRRSMPCCSMRPAPPPAPSAAIPTCPGSRARPTSTCLPRLQPRLLDRAVELTKPGGTLVYCVCSLEPEEGERQIEALLARDAGLPAGR